MKRIIDEMNKEELRKLYDFIGKGVRPIKASKAFGFSGKGSIEKTKSVRAYCSNKLIALDFSLLWETRQPYCEIAGKIWEESFTREMRYMDFGKFIK